MKKAHLFSFSALSKSSDKENNVTVNPFPLSKVFKTNAAKILATVAFSFGCVNSFAQANHWILPSGAKLNFSSGTSVAVTAIPTGSDLAGCTSFASQTCVMTDKDGNGPAFINDCGTYNLTGTRISTGGYKNVFSIPGICKRYFSIVWGNVMGTPSYNRLMLQQLDASNSTAITSLSTSILISDGTMHQGTAVAIAPLSADGSRKVYIADNYSLKSITIDSNGSYSSIGTEAALPALVDDRTPMEVSPDGKKIVMVHQNFSASVYDITSKTFSTLGSFPTRTVISGLEYVPYAGGDRIYMSYHTSGGTAGIGYVTLAAPSVLINGLTSIPGSTAGYGYGYTEIERGRDGKLYFAYHPNYALGYITIGDIGKLYSMDPANGVVNAVNIGVTQVNVNTLTSNWGYFIQSQIDGENYNAANYYLEPSLNVANATSTPTVLADLYICNGTLPINTTIKGLHTGYTVTVVTGSAQYFYENGQWIFLYSLATQPTPNSYTVTNSSENHTTDLLSNIPFLSSYTGDIYVTVKANGCGGSATTGMIFRLKGATNTFADFKAVKYNGGLKTAKAIQTTLPITSPMPVGSTNAVSDLQNAVDAITGWCTANTTMGIRDINTNTIGGSYTCRVYEAKDSTYFDPASGINVTIAKRQNIGGIDAPDIYRTTFPGAASGAVIDFNNSTVTFDGTKPPYYVDASNGFTDFDWFREYYKWAYDNNQLTAYSAKQYCVEVTVVTSTGCSETKKSFFRIANNGLKNGSGARMAQGETISEVKLYPNPAKNEVRIELPSDIISAKVVLMDMLGREVLIQNNITSNSSFNISHLPAGTYLYQVNTDGVLTHGKLVKQ